MKMQTENQGTTKDTQVIEAIQQMIDLYPEDTIDTAWDDIKECSFDGYKIGRGGRHIFIIRLIDDVRIIIITKD